MQYAILIIICVFLFIIGPIVLIGFTATMAPLYLQIIFVLWIALLMLSFIFIKEYKTPLTISIFITTVFSIVFTSWYVTDILNGKFDDGGLGNAIGVFLVPYGAAVPFCCIACKIRANIEFKAERRRLKHINDLKSQIKIINREINSLEEKLNGKKSTSDLLYLIETCEADVDSIENSKDVNNINQIADEIKEKNQLIDSIEEEIKRMEKA